MAELYFPKKNHPIPLRPLVENLCVFGALGFFMALVLAVGVSLEFHTEKIECVAMEPLSIYSFSILSVLGFFGLIVCNMTVAKTAVDMHASGWVKNVCLPVINSGLCAGAIIVGMSAGLAAGMFCYVVVDPQAWMVTKVFAGIAIMVVAILYPIVWMGRSMFDESDRERNISTCMGIVYCVTLSAVLWYLDTTAFWVYVLVVVVLSISVNLFLYLSKRRKQ